MEMPKPSAGHRKLEMLAGDWEGEERMYPSQWDPKGGTAVGRTRSRMAVGGFALVTDYEQERSGVVGFFGHGFYTYDPKKELYSLVWLDSTGSPPEVFVGGFNGDVLTLSHEGPPMHVRLTWDLTKAGSISSKMEMSEDGVTWKKLFDAEYRRTAQAG
ncbi:MAG: DUF1579 domain-containing protein [Ignavibacteria bacterium]|nr:DUF1579 domain-containing protein [Ignavibacteria bacterium]